MNAQEKESEDNVLVLEFSPPISKRWPAKIRQYSLGYSRDKEAGVYYVKAGHKWELKNVIVPPQYEFIKKGTLELTTYDNSGGKTIFEYKFGKGNGSSQRSTENTPAINLRGGDSIHALLELGKEDIPEDQYLNATVHLQFDHKSA